MYVSPETIYKTLYIQARGALKKELISHLRRNHTYRQPATASKRSETRGKIKDAISISSRPPEIEDRAVPGHWEGDSIEGAKGTFVATLVERQSRYVMLVKVNSKETIEVTNKLRQKIKTLPDSMVKTLTWDRGHEMANHVNFTIDTGIAVYFCDPRSPWQRGSNENTNGLLRQYLPKGMDLSTVSQQRLNQIAKLLNTRPRKTLGYIAPVDKLKESVALRV